MKYLLFLAGFFCVTGNYCHNLSFSGGIYGNKHIIYRRKNLKTFDLICISCLAGVISAGDVWRGRPAHSGKICFIRRCIRGFDRFSDHDYINKSDQQFRNGNHNFAGTADRKRKKRGRRTNRRNSNCHVCGDRSGHVDHYGCFCAFNQSDHERA